MTAVVQLPVVATPDDQILTTDADGRRWYTEVLHDGFRAQYEVREVVYDSTTGHQRLVVADTVTFGRMVSLDGITQVTSADEFVYHEMLAHTQSWPMAMPGAF